MKKVKIQTIDGKALIPEEQICQNCHGKLLCEKCSGDGYDYELNENCQNCNGSGACQKCQGKAIDSDYWNLYENLFEDFERNQNGLIEYTLKRTKVEPTFDHDESKIVQDLQPGDLIDFGDKVGIFIVKNVRDLKETLGHYKEYKDLYEIEVRGLKSGDLYNFRLHRYRVVDLIICKPQKDNPKFCQYHFWDHPVNPWYWGKMEPDGGCTARSRTNAGTIKHRFPTYEKKSALKLTKDQFSGNNYMRKFYSLAQKFQIKLAHHFSVGDQVEVRLSREDEQWVLAEILEADRPAREYFVLLENGQKKWVPDSHSYVRKPELKIEPERPGRDIMFDNWSNRMRRKHDDITDEDLKLIFHETFEDRDLQEADELETELANLGFLKRRASLEEEYFSDPWEDHYPEEEELDDLEEKYRELLDEPEVDLDEFGLLDFSSADDDDFDLSLERFRDKMKRDHEEDQDYDLTDLDPLELDQIDEEEWMDDLSSMYEKFENDPAYAEILDDIERYGNFDFNSKMKNVFGADEEDFFLPDDYEESSVENLRKDPQSRADLNKLRQMLSDDYYRRPEGREELRKQEDLRLRDIYQQFLTQQEDQDRKTKEKWQEVLDRESKKSPQDLEREDREWDEMLQSMRQKNQNFEEEYFEEEDWDL